ncbi:hypothetical protein ACUTQ5_15725 [Serratia sp. NA_112.1]|uniref:hypothetical protein n=1 Tax=Serratia sp. NA_112.1 TaxID=3415665 RepID=UPI004046AA5B
MMQNGIFSLLQGKVKYLLAAALLALGSLFNTALAEEDLMACKWDNLTGNFIRPEIGFRNVIDPFIEEKSEKYDCDQNGNNCRYRNYWNIPNRTYTITATAAVTCINVGNKSGPVKFSFEKADFAKSDYYKNVTMRISGAGSLYLSSMENMAGGTTRNWTDGSLAPCMSNCNSVTNGSPRYSKTLQFTFTVQPIKSRVDDSKKPGFDRPNFLGDIWVHSASNDPSSSYVSSGTSIPSICGLEDSSLGGCRASGGSGSSGPLKPPIPPCTLTITTPGVVEFQPISSDDLSRNRVRMEDFTLTATKGPVQSQTCVGSTYNLPGTIKTEGGYSISSTFWGINHSSGSPQGIGLKLFDLGKGSYLQFNHTYPSFIANIYSMSETKRIRAEIAATTNDLKRIKDGEYSQVLIFEVKMP